uniref:Transcriptional adapter n=1 Tax=Hanusia phi TaxID=3032 RepID=A0A7S0E6L2_9CRYP|mmetsp:Transcript_16486/g.37641  ORF Transcript_16486/g.37641 Transcript_16486/m.37641 type:complete len:520 (+) Transcript_16486:56-1615(+)
MESSRKRKIETRGEAASAQIAEEEQKRKMQAKLGRVHCNYCKRDVSDQMYIKSAVSDDVDLCMECFSVGVEINDVEKTDGKNPHKNDHPYRVMERLDFPLITEDWTAREEVALLEGIETYGLGNWAEVALVVGTKKKIECEFHYYANYINTGNGIPVPDVSRAISKTKFNAKSTKDDYSECIEAAVAGAGKIPGKFTKSEWKKAMLETKNITRENIRYYEGKPAGSDIVGYMPSRNDFDVEWDNDAEMLICDCVFDDKKDTDQDREIKTKVLEIYNWKLEERERRKKFILDRGLLDLKKHQSQERRRTKDERELYSQMRVFARFWSQEEHEEYMKGLVLEKRIRKHIELLQSYRKLGMRTEEEVNEYERKKKEQEEKQGKRGKVSDTIYTTHKTGSQRRSRNENDEENNESLGPLLLGSSKDKKQGAFEIKHMPGADYISTVEKQLCVSLRMTPCEYLGLKDAFTRESVRTGFVRREKAKQLLAARFPNLDASKGLKVYDSMVSSGWIRPTPASAATMP